MKLNAEFADAYNGFLYIDKKIKSDALLSCEFNEVIKIANETIKRRPIVCISSPEQRKAILNNITKWKIARDRLNSISPERFPLSSALFNPEPKIIGNVSSAQVYINSAVNSRLYPAKTLLSRLEKMRKSLINKVKSDAFDSILESIDKEIEYFTINQNEKFRLRSSGYTEVIVTIVHADKTEERCKASEIGTFLYPPANKTVRLYQPDEKPQDGIRQKRISIYDDIYPINTVLPLTGKLYLESELVNAKNNAQKLSVIRNNK